ncbi:Flp family type IVb pilin [Candidatus Viridilinea mediisalina]|uniref:Flp family type IVb pilin n=1 Tax=Candidatus Viridilinea mediisalina TaxID=2024553 RepID=A0A2A6RJ91_9CHLR|nr:Flp family type IVb pilin [Candidatus Viridilinea mediisalina]PDW02955.1 hypothetical protein CJ255_11290 [Candidatus Viridilinea mediisalina]
MVPIQSPDPPPSTSLLNAFWQHESQGWHVRSAGQGLVEYALLLVLIAIVVIGGLTVLGDEVEGVYYDIACALGGDCSADAADDPANPGGPRSVRPIDVNGTPTCPAGYSFPSNNANVCLRN